MTQEIEIEFKTLLNQADFHKLFKQLPFPNEPVEQMNHYFDTADMTLRENKSALRIREKDGEFTLTLKQAQKRSVLETHDTLSEDEFLLWMKGKPIAKKATTKQMEKLGISITELKYYGFLKTKRYAFKRGNMEYVLDESFYLEKHDYELELEANDYENGLLAFETLLHDYHIVKQQPITKIARFFDALQSREI